MTFKQHEIKIAEKKYNQYTNSENCFFVILFVKDKIIDY